MKKILGLVAGLMLAGCGGLSETTFSGGPTQGPGSTASIAGKVLSDGGAPVPGVRVVVHERISNAKFSGVSGDDGSFLLNVDPGVYDLGLDRENDASTATCFYGPLDTAGPLPSQYVLRGSGGRSASSVFGKIWLQPGTPAALRKLNLVTGHARNQPSKPADVPGRTQADGTFELTLAQSGERGMDIEVYDGSEQLDEFIDFGKLEKPVYLELATELSPVENRLRAGQSELTASAAAKDTTGGPFSQFDFTEDNFRNFALTGGVIPVDAVTRRVYDLLANPTYGANVLFLVGEQPVQIRVAADGMWWWKYAVHWGYPPAGSFSFTDESPDTYYLWISDITVGPGFTWHKVSYNSRAPRIVAIRREGEGPND